MFDISFSSCYLAPFETIISTQFILATVLVSCLFLLTILLKMICSAVCAQPQASPLDHMFSQGDKTEAPMGNTGCLTLTLNIELTLYIEVMSLLQTLAI